MCLDLLKSCWVVGDIPPPSAPVIKYGSLGSVTLDAAAPDLINKNWLKRHVKL
jgi:hypothetical protein